MQDCMFEALKVIIFHRLNVQDVSALSASFEVTALDLLSQLYIY